MSDESTEQGIEVVSNNDISGDPGITSEQVADGVEQAETFSFDTGDVRVDDVSDIESLPANFKSVEALAKSYLEAQRHFNRLTEQVKEKGELEEQLRAYEEIVLQSQGHAAAQHQYNEALETGDWREALSLTAANTRDMVRRGMGLPDHQTQAVAQDVAQGQQALALAVGYVQKQIGGERWNEVSPKLYENMQAHPEMFEAAITSADPNRIAVSFLNSINATQSAQTVHQMKIASMGLPGAAGRIPDSSQAEKDWSEIQAAARKEPGQYW